MEADKKIKMNEAVMMAAWTHNTNVNVHGQTPLHLVTGKSVIYPGLTTGNVATESLYDDEGVRKIMERQNEVMKNYRDAEFSRKLEGSKIERV